MYACYIDESGHCGEKYNPIQPVEVVLGVVTDITKLFKTQKEHGKVLTKLKEKSVDISELKGSEIYGRRKAWGNVSHEDRNKIISEVINWAEERVCKFIVCPIDAETFFSLKKMEMPWLINYIFLMKQVQ